MPVVIVAELFIQSFYNLSKVDAINCLLRDPHTCTLCIKPSFIALPKDLSTERVFYFATIDRQTTNTCLGKTFFLSHSGQF